MIEVALKFFGPVLAVMVFFSILSLTQRKEKVTATGDMVLEHGWIFKGVSWLCLFFSIAAPVAMHMQERHGIQEYGPISYVFAIGLFSLLFLYIYFETYFVKFTVRGSTIFCESPWRKSRRIEVDDIVDVSFSHALKYYKLKTKGGDIVWVYMYMKGIPGFLDLLEKHLGIQIERYN